MCFLFTVANTGLLWPPVRSRGALPLSWWRLFQKPLGSSSADGLCDWENAGFSKQETLSPTEPEGSSGSCFRFCILSKMLSSPAASSAPLPLPIFRGGNLLVVQTTQVYTYLQIAPVPSDFTLTALLGSKVASSPMAGKAHRCPE